MERFGNLNAVLNAETGALTQVAGMGETGAAAEQRSCPSLASS